MNQQLYKINLHAHSVFSDGKNTPYVMALKAKELGFSALVLTDHVYRKEDFHIGMVKEKEIVYAKAIMEARTVLPVIVGCEVPYKFEEVLVFGSSAVKEIWENNGLVDLAGLKKRHYCAAVLCHPSVHMFDFVEELDGFERYNSGQDFFKNERKIIDGIPYWSNSDAHNADTLDLGWNLTDKKIENEQDLIKYLKSGKQPTTYVYNEERMSDERLYQYRSMAQVV